MRTTVLSFYFLVLLGCGGLLIKNKVVDNYFLVATDVVDDLGLYYISPEDENSNSRIIKETVFAVGFNEEYVIIKQHPRLFPNPPNKNITNYYILPRKRGIDYKTNNGLIGPLTQEAFYIKRKELGIMNDVDFSIVYTDLE